MYAPRHPSTDSTTPNFGIFAESDVDSDAVFDALADADCRRILEKAGDETMTARELSADCDIPTSTLYRKLETLTEIGLLEECLRIRRDGKHASEYRRSFSDLTVSLSGESGVDIDVSPSTDTQSAEPMLAANR